MRETTLQGKLRVVASHYGAFLMRNNSGMAQGNDGRPVRFGLGNISSNVNREFKSSDLIGWMPDGRFLAIEVKRPGWVYRGTEREQAQLKFIEAVNLNGGVAGFAASENDLILLLMRDGPPMKSARCMVTPGTVTEEETCEAMNHRQEPRT